MTWVEVEGKTSAELRDNFMKQHVLPMAEQAFAADPDLQSIVVVVGQFWCDEADDAVHIEFIPCTSRDPKWPECAEDETYFVDEDGWTELNERGERLVGWTPREEFPQLDDNSSAITAFAAYCLEDCDQEMPMQESHTPYAIVLRGPDGAPKFEVVGKKLQPQWEDRFDVGFSGDPEPAMNSNPAVEATSAMGRWIKRVFRKE